METRITVKIEHKKKIFYEKILNVMKQNQDDKNYKYVLFKALENLKKCPFEVEKIADLKNIQGIGENIAVKLVETWNKACAEKENELSLKEVKQLKNEDFQRFLNSKKTSSGQRRNEQIEQVVNSNGEKEKRNEAFSIKKLQNVAPKPNMLTQPSIAQKYSSSTILTSSSQDQTEFRIIACRPFEEPRVILIADSREHRTNTRYKSVIEHLEKKSDISVEMRTLSVGDYIWICRKIDGSEIVMDWVVERKTWEDLQKSIRGGRYDEQKARLGMAPMKHRIYLIEANSKGDVACEQAVASTLSNGGYLIQRCVDTKDTADFLKEVTVLLQEKAEKDEISGVSFNTLQNLLQKKKAETVKEAWMRQLMVCPGMSYSRAEAIADRFPSMLALLTFFRRNGDDSPIELGHVLPQLNQPICRNLFKFFVA